MKNSEYWKERFQQLENARHESSAEKIIEIQEQIDKAQHAIDEKVNAWYQRFADNNNLSLVDAQKLLNSKELKEFKWDVKDYIKYGKENALNQQWMKELENASARVHISRLEQIKLQTQQYAEVAFGSYNDILDNHIKDLYKQEYYHTAFEIQKGIGVGYSFAGVNEDKLEKVISKPWASDGANFSDRIWTNKQKLVNQLHTSLTQMCITGAGPDKAISEIAKAMGSSKYQAGRLVMTESAFFGSEAQKECFNELDVEKYEIVATLDGHTSDICQEMDGKVFKMSEYESGVTAPPFHVNCRSCTCPHFDDEFAGGERAARGEDGKTYYVPADMTYKEWKEASKKHAAAKAVYSTEPVYYDAKNDYSLHIDTYSEKVNKGLSKAAESVAKLGSKDRCEHMYLVNLDTGNLDFYETNGMPNEVGYKFWKYIEEHKDEKFAFIHNHNTNTSFSEADIRTVLREEQIPVMIAVTNNAIKYVAERKKIVEETDFDVLYKKDMNELNKKIKDGTLMIAQRGLAREEIIVDNLIRDYTKKGELVVYDGKKE